MEEYFQPKIGGKVKIFSLCRKNNILNWLRKGLKKNELTFRTFENMETQASSLKVLHFCPFSLGYRSRVKNNVLSSH